MSDNIDMKLLAAYIAKQDNFIAAQKTYVSIYHTERCFGGPEEGGWWYDVITFSGGVPFPTAEDAQVFLEAAEIYVRALNKEDAPARYRAMSNLPDEDLEPCSANCPEGFIPTNWSDGGTLFVLIEDVLGQSDNSNQPPPHYE